MRLPGLTSLVLELPVAGGSAQGAETPAGSILPHRSLQTPPAREHSQPSAAGQELILACQGREELPCHPRSLLSIPPCCHCPEFSLG